MAVTLNEISVLFTTDIRDLISGFDKAEDTVNEFGKKDINLKVNTDSIDKLLADIEKLERTLEKKKLGLDVETQRSKVNLSNLEIEIKHLDEDLAKKRSLLLDTKEGTEEARKLSRQIEILENRMEQKKTELNISTQQSQFHINSLQSDIDALQNDINGRRLQLNIETSRAQGSLGKLGEGIAGLAFKFNQVYYAAAAVLEIIQALADPVVDVNVNTQKWQAQLETATGSVEKAKNLLKEYRDYADKTSYETGQAISNAAKFLNVSVAESDIIPLLNAIGDSVFAVGGGKEELDQVSRALTQVASKGKLSMEEVLQIAENGIPAFQIFQKELGLTAEQMGDIGNQGISSDRAIQAFIKGSMERFGGTMDKMAGKWPQLMSTLTSAIKNGIYEMSNEGFEEVEKGLQGITSAMQEASKEGGYFTELGQEVKGFIDDLKGVGEPIFELLDSVEARVAGFAIEGDLQQIGNFARELLDFLGSYLELLEELGVVQGTIEGLAFILFMLEALLKGINIVIAFSSAGFREAAASVKLFKDIVSGVSVDKAWAEFEASTAKINKQLDERVNHILGIKAAQKEQSDEASKQNKDRLSEQEKLNQAARKKAEQDIGDIKAELKNYQLLAQNKIDLQKAVHADAVKIAQDELALAQMVYEKEVEADKKSQSVKDGQYQKSKELYKAEADLAEKKIALLNAQIEKSQQLGRYVSETEKFLAEAAAIDKVGGDSEVKRYEAMKTALQDYLGELEKLRTSQISVAGSSAKAKAAQEAWQEESIQSLKQYNGTVAAYEDNMSVYRLAEQWKFLRQQLRNTNWGAQQRKEIYQQERQVFAEFQGAIASSIEGSMDKIQALQDKVLSTASQAIGFLKEYGNQLTVATSGKMIIETPQGRFEDTLTSKRLATQEELRNAALETAQAVENAWDSTGSHSLEQIQNIMKLKKEFADQWGIKLGIDVSLNEYQKAVRDVVSGAPQQIKQLKDGINDMVRQASQLGAVAADNFFTPWEKWLGHLKGLMGDLSGVKPLPGSGQVPKFEVPESTPKKKSFDNSEGVAVQMEQFGKSIDSLVSLLQSPNFKIEIPTVETPRMPSDFRPGDVSNTNQVVNNYNFPPIQVSVSGIGMSLDQVSEKTSDKIWKKIKRELGNEYKF